MVLALEALFVVEDHHPARPYSSINSTIESNSPENCSDDLIARDRQ